MNKEISMLEKRISLAIWSNPSALDDFDDLKTSRAASSDGGVKVELEVRILRSTWYV
jgi:hypothetical protein